MQNSIAGTAVRVGHLGVEQGRREESYGITCSRSSAKTSSRASAAGRTAVDLGRVRHAAGPASTPLSEQVMYLDAPVEGAHPFAGESRA